jgi:hypothetical protein
MDVRIFDSITQLDASVRGTVVVCGSHGALYPARLAASAGVHAVVFNDAGVGRHSAGIAGVAWLGGLGIPACAVDYRSARIGDGEDALASGTVSMVNDVAATHGCQPGHPCRLGGRPDSALDVDVFAAIFNDAGGGKDDAGYTRLPQLDLRGIVGATVSCHSARVGDGRSTYDTGVLSRVNQAGQRLDLREGLSVREAVARLTGLG